MIYVITLVCGSEWEHSTDLIKAFFDEQDAIKCCDEYNAISTNQGYYTYEEIELC